MRIPWDASYSFGIAEIDEQHKRFLEMLNETYDLVNAHGRKEELEVMLARVTEYSRIHFTTEEKYFSLFGYEDADEHIAKHRQLSESLAAFKLLEDGEDEFVLLGKLLDFLESWLIEHLSSMDRKYVACFKEHGLK